MYRILYQILQRVDKPLTYRFAYQWVHMLGVLYSLLRFKKTIHAHKSLTLLGLKFSHPIGLAAGFDRDARLLKWLDPTGLAFAEIGTVNFPLSHTGYAQTKQIIANIEKARNRRDPVLVGVSLGSLNEKLDAKMLADYRESMSTFWDNADYLVINLSRPGSPARRPAADNERLRDLLVSIHDYREVLSSQHGKLTPVLIKLALDQPCDDPPPAIDFAREAGLDGVIVAFEGWRSRDLAIKQTNKIAAWLGPLPLIVVGGIRTPQDAKDYLRAGARLVQIFTSLVEHGPARSREIVKAMW